MYDPHRTIILAIIAMCLVAFWGGVVYLVTHA